MLGFLHLQPDELSAGQLSSATLDQAINQVKRNGYVVLENALPVTLVDEMNDAFLQTFEELYQTDATKTEVNISEFRANRIRMDLPFRFSAGGTVTAAVGLNYTAKTKPNFIAPIYLQYTWAPNTDIPADAPPLFLVAATDDPLGLALHSVRMYTDWVATGKPAELHLYASGGHGFGMSQQGLPSDGWIQLFGDWLGAQGFLNASQ